MKLRFLLSLFFVLLSAQAFASDAGPFNSARRHKGESFREARARNTALLRKYKPSLLQKEATNAYEAAVAVKDLDFSKTPVWEDDAQITSVFKHVRDERFIRDDSRPNFPRRSTWFYPDDGCWARAALAGQRIESWGGAPRPAKLFIFGNLVVKTKNSPNGDVRWWYHVVPVILDKDHHPVVLDPAIDPRGPITLRAWVMTMTNNPESVHASICSPLTFGPYSTCQETDRNSERGALSDQKNFLQPEWQNLLDLKREPEKELGDSPNWSVFTERHRPSRAL